MNAKNPSRSSYFKSEMLYPFLFLYYIVSILEYETLYVESESIVSVSNFFFCVVINHEYEEISFHKQSIQVYS